jgi:hypothetical protein
MKACALFTNDINLEFFRVLSFNVKRKQKAIEFSPG